MSSHISVAPPATSRDRGHRGVIVLATKVRCLRRVIATASPAGASFAGMSWLALPRTALVVAIPTLCFVVARLEVRRYHTVIRRRTLSLAGGCADGVLRGVRRADPMGDRRSGERVPLDAHEVSTGPDRYAISDEGQLIAVREGAQVLAYPDHRKTCPVSRR